MLEHLERPRDALAELARVARGAVLVSVPREPLWRLSHLLALRDVRRLGNTPGHVNHWSSREFRRLAGEHGDVVSFKRPFPWLIIRLEPHEPIDVSARSLHATYFGTYERDYPRNAQVISCLRKVGVDVDEVHVPVWEDRRHKYAPGVGVVTRAIRAQARLARTGTPGTDVVIVGYPGHLDMAAARRAADGRPVVFNPLVSLEDTMVGDRQVVRPSSPTAVALRVLDRYALRHADLVIADTAAHREYFVERFGVSAECVAVCYVGAEDDLFFPQETPRDPFSVLFVAKLIPLHGVDVIVEAARLCPEIPFTIVGSGQLDGLLADHPPNVTWHRWVEYSGLPDLYRSAGCSLGVFGVTAKAARVIPNKAFHALATATPLVTADTPAARELLEDGTNALLVPPGDPASLATAIRRLSSDSALRSEIASRGRQTYLEEASEQVLGERWRALLEGLIHARQAGRG